MRETSWHFRGFKSASERHLTGMYVDHWRTDATELDWSSAGDYLKPRMEVRSVELKAR